MNECSSIPKALYKALFIFFNSDAKMQLVKPEVIRVYEKLPWTFRSRDLAKEIAKKFNKSYSAVTLNTELKKMVNVGLIKRVPPKHGKFGRKYIRNYQFLEDWARGFLYELKKVK